MNIFSSEVQKLLNDLDAVLDKTYRIYSDWAWVRLEIYGDGSGGIYLHRGFFRDDLAIFDGFSDLDLSTFEERVEELIGQIESVYHFAQGKNGEYAVYQVKAGDPPSLLAKFSNDKDAAEFANLKDEQAWESWRNSQ